MDLEQLRAFVETARSGSFSTAARLLGRAQPNVSRQLQQLERELGFDLLDREQRPVTLTPGGREFLACAETVVRELDATVGWLRGGELSGTLGVAASTIPGEFLVPQLLAGFAGRHSRVRPSLLITDSAGVAEELLARRVEVGFLGAKLAHRDLRLTPFSEDEIVLAVPAGHPFAEKGSIALAELAGQPLVEREGGSGTLGSLKRLLADQGLRMPEHRVAMLAGSSQTQLAAIEAGVGVGFVSSLAVESRPRDRVCTMRIEGATLNRPLYVAHERAPLSPIAQAFVRFVTSP